MLISQVAENRPERIARLIYLSAYLPLNGQSLFDLMAANRSENRKTDIEKALRLSTDKRSCAISPPAIIPLFYNLCAQQQAKRCAEEFGPQATLPLAAKVRLSVANFGRVPKTYIGCLHDRVIPLRQQQLMLQGQPCDEVLQLKADHSPFYSRPAELAEALHKVCGGE